MHYMPPEVFVLFASGLLPATMTAAQTVFASHHVASLALSGAPARRSHALVVACCVLRIAQSGEWRWCLSQAE